MSKHGRQFVRDGLKDQWNDAPEWNSTSEQWRTAGIESQAVKEKQEQIDRLKLELDSRIHRGHAALVLALSCGFCLGVGFMIGKVWP